MVSVRQIRDQGLQFQLSQSVTSCPGQQLMMNPLLAAPGEGGKRHWMDLQDLSNRNGQEMWMTALLHINNWLPFFQEMAGRGAPETSQVSSAVIPSVTVVSSGGWIKAGLMSGIKSSNQLNASPLTKIL